MNRRSAFVFLLLGLVVSARAQEADTLSGTLPAIEVTATRGTETAETAPLALSLLTRSPEEVALTPGLTLEEVLAPLPGLWVNARGHDAVGERVVVRGAGSRAAFGVRGIQALLDGIPLTMPDGQAILDVVDPTFIRRAELIRGPAAHFWGNGSGGALALSTAAFTDPPFGRIRALAGSYGTRHLAAETAFRAGHHRFHVMASDARRDGYRTHSAGRFTRGIAHGDLDLGARTHARFTAAFADQDAEHPGTLTADQFAETPRAANPSFVAAAAGKKSRHAQSALTLFHTTDRGALEATVYGILRTLDNPLPFAYIDLTRRAGGLRLAWRNDQARLPYGLALDAGLQHDDRRNDENDAGRPAGTPLLDQTETVRNLAASAHLRLPLPAHLHLTAGLRADHLRFSLDDHLPPDASGHRTFFALSPSVSLAFEAGDALFFAGLHTAFETPTTTELVNRPDGADGFNPEVQPERTVGVEAGARGRRAGLAYDVALFWAHVRDRLLPFQTATSEGRTFYRNSGGLRYAGIEAAFDWTARPGLTLSATYTGGRFVFDDGEQAGNRLPGVPDHRLLLALRFERRGLWGRLSLEAVSHQYTDDANTARADGYAVLDAHAGHGGLQAGPVRVAPFLQISNVFDVRYSASVTVNAFGGRYYEPAPGRTVTAGLNLLFD